MFLASSSWQRISGTLFRDRSYDRAAQRFALRLALTEQVRKCICDSAQIRDASPGLRKSGASNSPDVPAVGTVLQFEQRLEFLQTEAQTLTALDETDAVDMLDSIATISTRPPFGLAHQSTSLVVAHRFNPDACCFGDAPDSQTDFLHKPPLDSVLKYGHYSDSAAFSMTRGSR